LPRHFRPKCNPASEDRPCGHKLTSPHNTHISVFSTFLWSIYVHTLVILLDFYCDKIFSVCDLHWMSAENFMFNNHGIWCYDTSEKTWVGNFLVFMCSIVPVSYLNLLCVHVHKTCPIFWRNIGCVQYWKLAISSLLKEKHVICTILCTVCIAI